MAHEIRELPHDFLIAEVPPQDDFRHLEMILDDGDNLLAFFWKYFQFIEQDLDVFRARMNVIAFVVPMRLADVVKQQRKQQQLWIFEFIQNQRKTVLRRQLLNIADGKQRMLVNGVLVKEIADVAAL